MRSLWETIDAIREKPEAIRRRYLFGYVSITMSLIVGVWFLSVQESFRSVAQTEGLEDIKEQAGRVLPGSGGADSLSELFEKGEELNAGHVPVEMEDFFESEMRVKNQGGSETPPVNEAGSEK